jgi:methionyl-tRNA formyltransferase
MAVAVNTVQKESNMLRLTGLVVLVAVVLTGATRSQEKKAEAVRHKVDAHVLAVEFEKDAQAARQKYAPKGGTGGAAIEVSGIVQNVNDRTRTITFDTGTKVAVMLQAKRIKPPDQKSKQLAVQATGKFKSFEKNTVVIECDEAALLRIIGKDKK